MARIVRDPAASHDGLYGSVTAAYERDAARSPGRYQYQATLDALRGYEPAVVGWWALPEAIQSGRPARISGSRQMARVTADDSVEWLGVVESAVAELAEYRDL